MMDITKMAISFLEEQIDKLKDEENELAFVTSYTEGQEVVIRENHTTVAIRHVSANDEYDRGYKQAKQEIINKIQSE